MDFSIFALCKYSSEDTYFIEPTKKYFDLYSREFIDEVNKYSFGATDKFAICRIYQSGKAIHVSHFNNYVRELYTKNNKNFDNDIFKGIGKLLLKNILSYLIKIQQIKYDDKIYLEMVNTKNKKLVQFYESLSFVLENEYNFSSTVDEVMNRLLVYPIIENHI